MNRRARELGLTHTHYANAIGLDDPGNYSSAEDLVKLTLILRRNAFFRAVTDLPRATLRSGAHARTIVNRNLLVRAVPEVNGVKTGHTSSAGYILVGLGDQEGRRRSSRSSSTSPARRRATRTRWRSSATASAAITA